jgi:hypothetical protein
MSKTISTTVSTGITLSIPVVITSTGAVIYSGGGMAAVVDGGAPGTLTNDGSISSGGLSSVYLNLGGDIDNQAKGLITGSEAIDVMGAGTIVNAGTISGSFLGVFLETGIVQNTARGVISGGVDADTGTVVNYGHISAGYGAAVDFRDGGFVLNFGSKSTISGPDTAGVDIHGGAGGVVNQGVIDSVFLFQGGDVNNSGYIGASSKNYGIAAQGGLTSLENYGYIVGASFGAYAVISNAATAIISGYNNGIVLAAAGYVGNQGSIFGLGGETGITLGTLAPNPPGRAGVLLTNGGYIENFGAAALIDGRQDGIFVAGSAASYLLNQGTVIGDIGIDNTGSGYLTVYDTGTIAGLKGTAIYFGAAPGRLVIGAGGQIDGTVVGGNAADQVTFANGVAVLNFAGLSSEFVDITNFSVDGADISFDGPAVLAPGATLVNTGTMQTNGSLRSLGTLINKGALIGPLALGGLYSQGFPVGDPIILSNAAAGDVFSAASITVYQDLGGAAATIINAGTIAAAVPGGIAISLSSNVDNLLVIDPGSTIIGAVDGGSAAGDSVGSVLELAAGRNAGTISGIGSIYAGFATVELAAGAIWNVGASSGDIQLDAGAALVLDGPATSNETINLAGAGSVLILDDAANFAGTIVSFETDQTIDLANMAFNKTATVTLEAGNVLDVVINGETCQLRLDPSADDKGEKFHLSSDGADGTDLTETAVACFLRGTSIRTPGGDVAVETLAIGDAVTGADGKPLAVKWIGRRSYEGDQAQNPEIGPIRLKASALYDGIPDRDLCLSPSHAVLIEGLHVPAGGLVNGVSILPAPAAQKLEYFHIETERHSSIIANNTPAETFIDDDSRRLFDNADEFYRLYPGEVSQQIVFGVPRLESGRQLEALRRKFALRAGVAAEAIDAAPVIGFLESADRQTISGWACNPATPNTPVCLEILNRGAVMARILANAPRPDVRLAGFGHGRCGFSLTLPAPLPAFQRHEISVRPAGSARPLTGSPIVMDPGFVHDLVKTGGLRQMVGAAIKSLSGAQDIFDLEADLELSKNLVRSLRSPAGPARKTGRTILMIDQHWPTPTRDAGSNALLSHAQAFQALGYQVAFCAAAGPPRNILETAGLLRLQDMRVACYGQDGAAAEDTIKMLAASGLALVYLHRLAIAASYAGLVRHRAPACRIIYAVADLHHLRLARQADITGRQDLRAKAGRTKATEFWAMRMADHVLTHSSHEAAYLRQAVPDISVHVVPWSVEMVDTFKSRMHRPDIAFIGGADHAPNVDAVLYLAQNILPAVWEKIPALRCLVIGEGWPTNIFGGLDPRLAAIGHHADLGQALSTARLTVAPLRFGAGLKGKVLESFAAAVPCVMSGIAAEGLTLDPHLQSAVSDLPNFAATLLDVYASRRKQAVIARSGQAMLACQFSAAAVTDSLSAMLGLASPQPAMTDFLKNSVSIKRRVLV